MIAKLSQNASMSFNNKPYLPRLVVINIHALHSYAGIKTNI